jgi:hypothetical protein
MRMNEFRMRCKVVGEYLTGKELVNLLNESQDRNRQLENALASVLYQLELYNPNDSLISRCEGLITTTGGEVAAQDQDVQGDAVGELTAGDVGACGRADTRGYGVERAVPGEPWR